MTYFVMMPGDTEKEVYFDSNLLGENTGFGVFWAGAGLKILMKMVDSKPEMLPDVKIKTDKGKTLTVEEFLTEIKGLKVRVN
tara:strand:- start:1856 stop:2101 length:246 start_codon:yes stop_codon:yes gene_type:complete